MLNLTDLLRNLFYSVVHLPRQVGTYALTVLVIAGVATPNGRIALEYVIHIMVYLIGSAVVLNVVLRHGNDLLQRLVKEQSKTRDESHRTLGLLKALLVGKSAGPSGSHPTTRATKPSSKNRRHRSNPQKRK